VVFDSGPPATISFGDLGGGGGGGGYCGGGGGAAGFLQEGAAISAHINNDSTGGGGGSSFATADAICPTRHRGRRRTLGGRVVLTFERHLNRKQASL
jgi:hypothetical protein